MMVLSLALCTQIAVAAPADAAWCAPIWTSPLASNIEGPLLSQVSSFASQEATMLGSGLEATAAIEPREEPLAADALPDSGRSVYLALECLSEPAVLSASPTGYEEPACREGSYRLRVTSDASYRLVCRGFSDVDGDGVTGASTALWVAAGDGPWERLGDEGVTLAVRPVGDGDIEVREYCVTVRVCGETDDPAWSLRAGDYQTMIAFGVVADGEDSAVSSAGPGTPGRQAESRDGSSSLGESPDATSTARVVAEPGDLLTEPVEVAAPTVFAFDPVPDEQSRYSFSVGEQRGAAAAPDASWSASSPPEAPFRLLVDDRVGAVFEERTADRWYAVDLDPAALGGGPHLLEVTGVDQAGEPVVIVRLAITVAVPESAAPDENAATEPSGTATPTARTPGDPTAPPGAPEGEFDPETEAVIPDEQDTTDGDASNADGVTPPGEPAATTGGAVSTPPSDSEDDDPGSV